MLHIERKTPSLSEESISTYQKALLNRLITMTEKITTTEGSTSTIIPFLSIMRDSQPTPLNPVVLSPSFCLILQGTKKLHLGANMLYFHAGDYLASMIDIPASAQTIGVTRKSPYIGLHVALTTQEIASVVMEAQLKFKPKGNAKNSESIIGKFDADLLELLIRLLKLADRPQEAPFLSSLIKREMIFKLLAGDYGHLLFQHVLFDPKADGVGKAIAWIKANYSRSFTAQELANSSNMSISDLRHKFKAITTMGPLQYQKQLRLQEARRLMLSGAMDATTAALEVGYESPSQFTREYRRLFGLPPHQDIKTVQAGSMAGKFQNG